MEIIEVRDIDFSYGTKDALKGISFSMEKGEITAILGPNGCGKTTLLDCIIGFHRPRNGGILIKGKDLAKLAARESALDMAYIPQKTSPAFAFSVLDMAVSGRAAHLGLFSAPGEEDYDRARGAREEVGIARLEDRSFETLSGGESQLVIISRARCQDADIPIMDEPTAHLDFYNS